MAMSVSQKSQRIDDWLEETCDVVGKSDILTPPLSPIESSKRKRTDEMLTTHQPSKRPRNDSPPPDLIEETESIRSRRSEVPTLRSESPTKTAKTSRSGSPSKRQRDRIAILSTPYLEVKTPLQTIKWKAQAAAKDVPLLTKLFQYLDDDITDDEPNVQDATRERLIVREVDKAVKDGLNEDQWSDAVVLPFLQAAQARSRRRRCRRTADSSHDPCDECEEDEVAIVNV